MPPGEWGICSCIMPRLAPLLSKMAQTYKPNQDKTGEEEKKIFFIKFGPLFRILISNAVHIAQAQCTILYFTLHT
jgi:hypothetical protein